MHSVEFVVVEMAGPAGLEARMAFLEGVHASQEFFVLVVKLPRNIRDAEDLPVVVAAVANVAEGLVSVPQLLELRFGALICVKVRVVRLGHPVVG